MKVKACGCHALTVPHLCLSACVSWWKSTGSGTNLPAHQQVSHSLNTSAEQHPQTTALPVATNKARHIRAQYRTISNSPGVAAPLPPSPVKLKVIFLSLFLAWSSTCANCNLQSAAVSGYDAHCFLFGCSRIDRISKILTFPDCSWSESSSRVS